MVLPCVPRSVVILLALTGALTAQASRLPSPIDNARIVQVHDVRAVLESLTPPPGPALDAATLAGYLRSFVQPPLDDGETIVPLTPGLLMAHARPEQQAWIERVVRANMPARDRQIDLEVRVLSVPAALHTRVVVPRLRGEAVTSKEQPGWAFTSLPSAVVDRARLGDVLAALRGDDVVAVTAPRLLAWVATGTSVMVGKEVRYIRDYEVEVVDSGLAVPVAQIGTMLDGTRLHCGALPLGGGEIGVSFRFELGELLKLTKFETSLAGDSRKLTLELPTWKNAVLETAAAIPGDGAALFAFPERDGRHTLLLLRAAIVR